MNSISNRCVLGLATFDRPEDWQDGKARDTIFTAYEKGIRRFDVAALYGGGVVETELGKVLQELRDPAIRVSTKIGRYRDYGDRPPRDGGKTDVRDLSYETTKTAVARSRSRLGEYLQTVFIHDSDDHLDEALLGAGKALAQLRAEGTISAMGVASNSAQAVADHMRHGKFDAVMLANSHSIIYPDIAGAVFDLAEYQNVEVYVAGIYLSGILATGAKGRGTYRYQPPPSDILKKVALLEAECETHNVALRHIVMDFLRRNNGVSFIVIGAGSPEQVKENIKHFLRPLDEIVWRKIIRALDRGDN